MEVRTTILSEQKRLIASFLAQHCVEIIDKALIGGSTAVLTPLGDAFDEYSRRVKKSDTDNSRDPAVDFAFSVSIFPYGKKFYGIVHTEHKALKTLLFENNFVEDFSYWDNADREDHISAKQWSNRRRIWQTIFENSWVPQDVGFSFTINPNHLAYRISREECFELIPTMEERIKTNAHRILLDEYVVSKQDNTSEISNVYQIIFEAMDWLKTENGMCQLEKKRSELTHILRPLTESDLQKLDLKTLVN